MAENANIKFSSKPIMHYPIYKLTNTIFIRKTDEKYAKNLVKFWTDTDVSSLSISLKCPITMSRLKLPCRGEDCTHLQCFDGHSFLKMNEKQFGKWLCNICQKPAPLNKLYVDGLVLDILKSVSEDTDEIFFDENGNWNDSKQDKKDISVIDLCDTLEIIDLTESSDESDVENTPTPIESDKNGKSTEESDKSSKENLDGDKSNKENLDGDKSSKENLESDKSKKDNLESKEKEEVDRENIEKSCDSYPKSNTHVFVQKNMPSTNKRLVPYTQTNPKRRKGHKENEKSCYNLRRPLHDRNHRYINRVSQNTNQQSFEVIVNAPNYRHINPNLCNLNIYFSNMINFG